MYKISFEISALILSLLCFAYCIIAKRRQYIPPKGLRAKLGNQHFLFLVMLLTNALSSISSVVGVYLTTIASAEVAYWQYFFHALYFIFHTTLSLAFGLYIMSVTGTVLSKNRFLGALFFVPYLAAEILILTNRLTSWAFYMDEAFVYHRGLLMPLLYGIGAFYVVMGFVFFFKNVKAITKADRIAVGVFIGIATAGIVVQAVRSEWLVELFAEALACSVIMIVLEEKAGHVDPLTGLLNRVAFDDNNRRMMTVKQRYDIVLIKIAELGKFTKRFNVRAADELLMEVASYFAEEARSADVYCYRREEFAVIFKEGEGDANRFAEDVIKRFEREWDFESFPVVLEAVAVVVRVPDDVKTFDELKDLMSVNYQKANAGSYVIPFGELSELAKDRYYQEAIRKAIDNHELEVRFQPIWSVKEKKTVSAEALLRIPSEELKDVSPEIYIPIAEKSGLIHEIGLYVFESVCRYLAEEKNKESPIRYIELNLSVYQFMFRDLVASFEEIRKKYGVPSNRINLEITETGGALAKKEVLDSLERFKELGYSLSLDDFGTGYSNFVRMIKCKFGNVKIDKSILWNLAGEAGGRDILQNLMSFIKSQGSSIIQEGVETKEQLDLVISCGCDYVQGFYFGQALKESEFALYLAKEAK